MKFKLREVDLNGNEIGVSELDLNVTQEQLDEYDNSFCKCDFRKENSTLHVDYVEHYKGVSHGWICTKCKKFVQIG